MRHRIGLIVLIVVGSATAAGLAHRHATAADALRAESLARAPIGSRRDEVDRAIRPLQVTWSSFDYPSGDPRQGTLSIGFARPVLAFSTVHLVLHFDRARPHGKLTEVELSVSPISVPSP